MRVLVVGAGALGGYFGARLLQAGIDVTFLVRPHRAEQLRSGLTIKSPFGDFELPAPPTVLASQLQTGFDLILLSCKAYDLDSAMDSLAPAVDSNTTILPLLNGMKHLVRLRERFGSGAPLGGTCLISSTMDPAGTIIQMSEQHQITFGELEGNRSARIETIADAFARCKFTSQLSDTILQDMWDKWVFIASLASATCLMRASVGDIIAADGLGFLSGIVQECAAIAAANGYPLKPAVLARAAGMLSTSGSPITASMLRDMERGGRIEADQIVGDLLECARGKVPESSRVQMAYLHLKTYEQRRAREQSKVVSSG